MEQEIINNQVTTSLEEEKQLAIKAQEKLNKKIHIQQIFLKIVLYIICILVGLMCVIPIYLLFINATRDSISIQQGLSFIPGSNLINNWNNLMDKGFPVFRSFINSAFIAFSGTALCIYFSALTAYAIYAYNFKWKKAVSNFITLLIIIPGQLGMIGFYQLVVDFGMLDTYYPLILPAIASPATVFYLCQYYKANFNLEYVEAARIDGAGEFRIFNMISLPIIKPALATMGLLGIISSWNSYMGPLMFLQTEEKYTFPLLIQLLKTDVYSTDYGAIYLGIALTVLPLLIIYFFLSKQITRGVAMGGVKG